MWRTAGWKPIVLEGESALFHEIVVPSDEEGELYVLRLIDILV